MNYALWNNKPSFKLKKKEKKVYNARVNPFHLNVLSIEGLDPQLTQPSPY